MEEIDEKMESVESSPAENTVTAHSLASGVYTKAFAMVGITTGYIFGPIILIGGIGYYISQALDNRIPLFLALLVAFAASNWLIFKHTPKVMEKLALKDADTPSKHN